MLASLLPGLRDLRTPLATGYLWLVVLWLLLHDNIPTSLQEATGPLHSLYELGALAGRGPVLAAVTFVAYVLGAILLVTFSAAKSGLRISGESIMPSRYRVDRLYRIVFRHDPGHSLYQQLHTFVSMRFRQLAEGLQGLQVPAALAQADTHEYVSRIAKDLYAVSVQLQAKNRDYWDTYDRQYSEAQFRLGIAVPLAVIIVIVAAQSSALWLVLLIVPLWLLRLSWGLAFDCLSTLVQAIVLEMVEPPPIEYLREEVEYAKVQAKAQPELEREISRGEREGEIPPVGDQDDS